MTGLPVKFDEFKEFSSLNLENIILRIKELK